ncbi:MAG: hypothetical protein LBS21_01500 [Clostridiales bacterium]|jgi:hypothetical protein|nr:hypothetical protein [Clostridiales bacterium]
MGLTNLAETAAEVKALKEQFASVFSGFEAQADKSLNSVANNAGVAAGRMKGSFTQIAAFAKTTGMDTSNSLGLAERAMVAVADSAAFYDKSIEQQTASLQSFLKGNFENDAALGLSATETTRNAAANALYGKSFVQLAEDQKQLTLLKMVEDANTLSGALGQSARESDSWTNQLGNFKQKITDLKAALGNTFLKPAIDGMKAAASFVGMLTEGIEGLVGEGSFINRMFERMTRGIKRVQSIVERFVKRIGGAEQALKLLAIVGGTIFIALNAGKILSFFGSLGNLLSGANLKMLGLIAVAVIFALLIEDFIKFMQGEDSLLGELLKNAGFDLDEVRNKIKNVWDGIKNTLSDLWGKISEIGISIFEGLKQFWATWGDDISKMFIDIFMGILDFLEGGFTGDWEQAFNGISSIATSVFNTLSDVFGGFAPIVWTVVGAIGALKLAGMITGFLNLASAVAGATGAFGALVIAKFADKIETLQIIGLYAKDYITALGNSIASMAKAGAVWVANTAKLIANKVATLAVTAAQKAMSFGSFIVSIAKAGAAWVANTVAMLASKAAMLAMSIAQKAVTAAQWLLNAAMSANPIALIIIAIVALIAIFIALWNNNEGFRNFFIGMWEGIKTAIGAIVDWFKEKFDAIKEAFGAVGDFFSRTIDEIIKFFQPFLDIIDKVSSFIKDGLGNVKDFFTNLFGGDKNSGTEIPGYAKGTNRTPDTFIAGENGAELITGAKGRKVFNAAQTGDIFKTLSEAYQTARSALIPNASTVSNAVSNVGNKNVVQNVEISNQFNGDRAGQQKSAAAMEKASGDATAALARGLAFVRG